MFVKRELSESDRLRKKIRLLPGKSTKDKFRALMGEVIERLEVVKKFDRELDPALFNEMKRVQEDHRDQLQTTSKESVLESLIVCDEDLEKLIDDMTHTVAQATYNERLKNITSFLKDFQNVAYTRDLKLYDEPSSRFVDQLGTIAKDMQYKISKMTHQVRQITQEIETLEMSNIELAQKLSETNQESYVFKDIAARMQDQHQNIELKDSSVSLMRKTMNSFRLLSHLFEQLTLLEEYHQYMKTDGYIRRLVKRLYRKPEQLDLLDNTADLTEAIQKIKAEIVDVESIVKPAKKMLFEDLEENVDSTLIEKYKAMVK